MIADGHHNGCICDLCEPLPPYTGNCECTCSLCDPEHPDDCRCDRCVPNEDSSMQSDLSCSDLHHYECVCDVCCGPLDYSLLKIMPCECAACEKVELPHESPDAQDDYVTLSESRINSKIITITQDDLGDLWVSSHDVNDFTREEVYAIDLAEAKIEFENFKKTASAQRMHLLPNKTEREKIPTNATPYMAIVYSDDQLTIKVIHVDNIYAVTAFCNNGWSECIVTDTIDKACDITDKFISKFSPAAISE